MAHPHIERAKPAQGEEDVLRALPDVSLVPPGTLPG